MHLFIMISLSMSTNSQSEILRSHIDSNNLNAETHMYLYIMTSLSATTKSQSEISHRLKQLK